MEESCPPIHCPPSVATRRNRNLRLSRGRRGRLKWRRHRRIAWRLELLRSRTRPIQWHLHHRTPSGRPWLHNLCRAAGRRGSSHPNQPGDRLALPQPSNGRRLASIARMRSTRTRHYLYDPNPPRTVKPSLSRSPTTAPKFFKRALFPAVLWDAAVSRPLRVPRVSRRRPPHHSVLRGKGVCNSGY